MQPPYDAAALVAIAGVVFACDQAFLPAKFNTLLAVALGIASQVLIGLSTSHPVWSNTVSTGVAVGLAALSVGIVVAKPTVTYAQDKRGQAQRPRGLPSPESELVVPGQE